ncbi:S-layer homology domain-containing protein [Thiolapillus brandeum]|uniref:S-layer homology domain-containing protein n=1 Tax=Thiolapillus brandeum TaxID=1076588 RepID=UPI000596F370|nr:S-layer homology domain-containing protein [Thiolapillus brandeum]
MKKLFSTILLLTPMSVAWLPAHAQLDEQGNDLSMAIANQVGNESAGVLDMLEALPEPKYGTSATHVHASWSSDCDPIRSTFTYGQNFGWRWSTTGASSWFDCTVDIPQGASLIFVGVEVYDNDATNDVVVRLNRAGFLASDYVQIGTDSTTGQGTSRQYLQVFPTTATTADYLHNTYLIRIELAGDSNTQFRSVFSVYQLQVSPAPTTATFNDVSSSHPFFQYIEALAASGITSGCTATDYCPDDPLTRGQMAVFLSKALGLHWWN